MTRIVLTGTTGHVGGGAIAELAAAGHDLCQIVRDPARAPAIDGVETVVATGLDDRDALRATLRRGDRVFLVSAWTGHDERVRLHRAFIDAASDAEVGHLVYLSFVNAHPDAAFSHARSHADTERDLRASGLPFSILRTSYYQLNLEAFFVDGIVRGPSGRVGWVSRTDCSRALAGAMAGAAEVGETYDLTRLDADAPGVGGAGRRAARRVLHLSPRGEADGRGSRVEGWHPRAGLARDRPWRARPRRRRRPPRRARLSPSTPTRSVNLYAFEAGAASASPAAP